MRLVTLNMLVKAAQNEVLGPEVQVALNTELHNFADWLDDNDDVEGHEVLQGWLETYLESGEWQGEFTIEPLPPGSPI